MSKRQISMVQAIKMLFGIFMVLFYLAVAAAMALNLFQWTDTPLWKGVRWFLAVLFGLYGFYRGYREVKGEHTYGMRTYDDQDDGDQYLTYAERLKKQEGGNDDEK